MHASISTISYRESSDTKKDTQQYLENATKIDQVLKQKTKNSILAKREK